MTEKFDNAFRYNVFNNVFNTCDVISNVEVGKASVRLERNGPFSRAGKSDFWINFTSQYFLKQPSVLTS